MIEVVDPTAQRDEVWERVLGKYLERIEHLEDMNKAIEILHEAVDLEPTAMLGRPSSIRRCVRRVLEAMD